MAQQNANFDDVITSSIRNSKKSIQDLIYNHNYTFKMMDELGFTREQSGGYEIQENLMFEENSTVRSFSRWDLLDNSPQDTVTAAQFEWKQVAGSVTIDHFTEFQNSGASEKIFDLLEAKIMQLQISMATYFNEKWLSGDGTGNGGKDIPGLALFVEEGTAWSTVGNINSSTYSQWRNQWTGSVGSFASNGADAMRAMYNSCSSGIAKPKIILTTQAVFQYYEKLVQSQYRSMDLKKADIGYTNILFKETPVMFDEDIIAGYMYFLNPTFMRLVYGKGKKFAISSFMQPINQDGKVAHCIVYLTPTINHRARQGVLTGITA